MVSIGNWCAAKTGRGVFSITEAQRFHSEWFFQSIAHMARIVRRQMSIISNLSGSPRLSCRDKIWVASRILRDSGFWPHRSQSGIGVSSKGVNIIFMFFCLDAKEPKGQEVAKLLPHMPHAGPLPLQPTAPICINTLLRWKFAFPDEKIGRRLIGTEISARGAAPL